MSHFLTKNGFVEPLITFISSTENEEAISLLVTICKYDLNAYEISVSSGFLDFLIEILGTNEGAIEAIIQYISSQFFDMEDRFVEIYERSISLIPLSLPLMSILISNADVIEKICLSEFLTTITSSLNEYSISIVNNLICSNKQLIQPFFQFLINIVRESYITCDSLRLLSNCAIDAPELIKSIPDIDEIDYSTFPMALKEEAMILFSRINPTKELIEDMMESQNCQILHCALKALIEMKLILGEEPEVRLRLEEISQTDGDIGILAQFALQSFA